MCCSCISSSLIISEIVNFVCSKGYTTQYSSNKLCHILDQRPGEIIYKCYEKHLILKFERTTK